MGRPGKIAGLRKFIEYIQEFEGVWTPRRIEIAEHWAKTHPHERIERPSQMSADRFVQQYGSIFEHSAWIAKAAHAMELGPAHDTAVGLHSVLARVFRNASKAQKLEVLNAHPDLAGKLAAAGALTNESTSEQASAGLDLLTDQERSTFQSLNTEYVKKHGFPFIIAVRDHDKASILRAFKRRIDNSSETEFQESCRQGERIAAIRLEAILP